MFSRIEHEKRFIPSGPDSYPIANTEHVDFRVLAYILVHESFFVHTYTYLKRRD